MDEEMVETLEKMTIEELETVAEFIGGLCRDTTND